MAFCRKCSKQIDATEAVFRQACGTPVIDPDSSRTAGIPGVASVTVIPAGRRKHRRHRHASAFRCGSGSSPARWRRSSWRRVIGSSPLGR